VPEAGDYFTLDLFDEMLVIVRGRDSVIRTLSRICTHRWAPLVEGNGNAKLFSCPFHKWGFDLTGKLLGAPLMDKVEFCQEDYDLTRFPTEVIDGFIYVNLSGDAPSLAPQLAYLSAQLAKFRLDELIIVGEYSYDCKFNWKIMMETFMECFHHIATNMPGYEAFMEKEMQQLGVKTGTARPGRLSHLEKAVWQLSDYVRAKIAQ
jgi:phenylpropionate dioxygenase-like ring-hydroxylating dioxygenase large terminal subunit